VIIVYLQDNMLAVWAAVRSGFVPCLLPNLTAKLDHRRGWHIEHLNALLSSFDSNPIWLTHQTGAGRLNETGVTVLNIQLFDVLKKSTETTLVLLISSLLLLILIQRRSFSSPRDLLVTLKPLSTPTGRSWLLVTPRPLPTL
jgi:hypothetical protein